MDDHASKVLENVSDQDKPEMEEGNDQVKTSSVAGIQLASDHTIKAAVNADMNYTQIENMENTNVASGQLPNEDALTNETKREITEAAVSSYSMGDQPCGDCHPAFGTSVKDLPVCGLEFLKNAQLQVQNNNHLNLCDGCTDTAANCRTEKFVLLPCQKSEEWSLVVEALSQEFCEFSQVEATLTRHSVPLDGLHMYFERKLEAHMDEINLFGLIPKIVRLALELPEVCKQSIPVLKKQKDYSITLSQKQIACLLANAFFCLFPRQENNCVYLTFAGLFRESSQRRQEAQFAKLDCIFNYFERVTKAMPEGNITFHRQVLKNTIDWASSECAVSNKLRVSVTGRLPDDAYGMLHVDFANKYVGGGMLDEGCVQEEILFMLYPELNISRLFTEELESNETLIVTGCERFNESSGYGSSFRWTSDYNDEAVRDCLGRRSFEIVAMDAMPLWNAKSSDQLSQHCLDRELNKAYCGFATGSDLQQCKSPTTVATGNWGCGAFGGNPYIKALVQLMAASQANRSLYYFTFDDYWLGQSLFELHESIKQVQCTVGVLYNILHGMARKLDNDEFGSVDYANICAELVQKNMVVQR